MDMFRKFNKYFKIYWTTIFCLLALCVTILMVTGYNSQKREKENEESLSQMTQFEQERKDLEFKVATVISLGRTLTEYDCVKKFAADNNIYDKMNFANVNEVSTVLAANQLDFDSLGLDIHLFKEIGDVIIAPLQTYDVDEFEEINNITKDDIVNIFADDNLKYSYKIIPRMEQEGTMMFVFRRTYSQFNKIYGLVYFKGANIRCVQSYDNQIVFIGDKCKDNNFKKLKLKDLIEDAVYRQKLDDKEHNVYGVLKNYPDMIYLTSYLFEEVGTIRTIYIILYLLTVIFAFLVSFYITKVIYKPIASLINIFGGDVMTSYDEFAFLSQEVRKNLNINNDLILELDNIKRERKYKFLYDLLNGFVWGDGISKSINQYNLLFLCNRCNVVMFEFRLSSASSSSDGFYVIDGYTSLLYLDKSSVVTFLSF